MADQDTTEILTGPADQFITQVIPRSAPMTDWTRAGRDAVAALPSQPTLVFQCLTGNAYATAHQEAREHVLFELTAGSSSGVRLGRSPVNICLCLDRSGSMEGDPLAYAKRACNHVIDILEPDDVLSVITFAERGEVLFNAQKVGNKDELKAAVAKISIGNRTNLHQGLEVAIEQILAGKSATSLNRIMLLTDGEPTAGNKDFTSIVTLVTDRKRDGIKVTALGFGPDYNEELVAALARRTGGNYYYISRPELLPEVFRLELDSLMRTVARELKLQVNLVRGVSVRQVYGNDYQQAGARTFEVNLVDVEREGALTSLWEMDITPHPAGLFRIGSAELQFEDCSSRVRQELSADIMLEFTRNPSRLAAGINPRVQREIQIMMAARRLDRTMIAMRSSGTAARELVSDLERTQNLLIQHGQTDQADQIKQALADIRSGEYRAAGGSVEKTLIGAIVQLDQGKRS
jgi:Ca-activated chloride channel family protein